MSDILAIDPGPEQTAYVALRGSKVLEYNIVSNADMRSIVGMHFADELAIEGIACYGMPVGKETFETCIWIGRFMERWESRSLGKNPPSLVYRQEVKMHLCKKTTAKDANIRQALIDLFGPGKEKAIGKKKTPGPLYGIATHCWAALAVGVTFQATRPQ